MLVAEKISSESRFVKENFLQINFFIYTYIYFYMFLSCYTDYSSFQDIIGVTIILRTKIENIIKFFYIIFCFRENRF